MLSRTTFSDRDQERITERARELSPFEKGDAVTVEPADHDIAYAGRELEGMLLHVSGFVWRGNDLTVPDNARAATYKPDDHEERFIELQDEYEYYVHDAVYLSSVGHDFREDDRGYGMSTSALIPFEEFREEYDWFKTQVDGSTDRQRTVRPADDPCGLCGCEMIARIGTEDPALGWYGRTQCPCCYDVKSQVHP